MQTLKHNPIGLNIEQTHPIIQMAILVAISVVMTAVFFGFLVGTQI